MFGLLWSFINYWYLRYLLVSELYMVEKWERHMFHIVCFILLSIISLVNYTIVLGLVSAVTSLFYGSSIGDLGQHIKNEL